LQPPGGDAVVALLVFLQLLKTHAREAAERALRHPALQPQGAQLVPDRGILGADAALIHMTSEDACGERVSGPAAPPDPMLFSKRSIYTIKPPNESDLH